MNEFNEWWGKTGVIETFCAEMRGETEFEVATAALNICC